jgi:hypothetical protein
MTVAPANNAAPTSGHLDLIRIPHVVIARNRLAERGLPRQFCCGIPSSTSLSWMKSRALTTSSPAPKMSAIIVTKMQTDTAFRNNFQILPRLPRAKVEGTLKVL